MPHTKIDCISSKEAIKYIKDPILVVGFNGIGNTQKKIVQAALFTRKHSITVIDLTAVQKNISPIFLKSFIELSGIDTLIFSKDIKLFNTNIEDVIKNSTITKISGPALSDEVKNILKENLKNKKDICIAMGALLFAHNLPQEIIANITEFFCSNQDQALTIMNSNPLKSKLKI